MGAILVRAVEEVSVGVMVMDSRQMSSLREHAREILGFFRKFDVSVAMTSEHRVAVK